MKAKKSVPSGAKRPYRAPRLTVHGDFRKITAVKGGSMNDGGGKPRTRSFGFNT